MPRNTLCCLKGVSATEEIMEDAKQHGLNVVVPYPLLCPNTFDIITTKVDNSVVYKFLEKYENNPEVVILYDHRHPKCNKKAFRPNVAKNELPRSEQMFKDGVPLKQNNIHDLPDILIPAAMRDYYNFPTITPEHRTTRPKIGIISLGGYYSPTDLQVYWQKNMEQWNPSWGWPEITPNGPIDVVVGDNVLPEFARDIYSLENTIDIELIGGFCPSADIYFYSAMNTYQGYLDAFKQAITDQMDIVSTSWGGPEETFYGQPVVMQLYNEVFKSGTTGRDPFGHKISDHYTIFTTATGDYGSSDNNYTTYNIPGYSVTVPVPHADFPATSPWVIACGGTSLFYDRDTLINAETSWIYGGGGQSSQFLRPAYQGPWKSQWPVSPLVKKDPSTGLPFARTVPDVVFNADPNSPWYIFFSDYDDEGAGTSSCAPIMASLLGEFYCASKTTTAPKNGYFGEGFNSVFYRAPSNSFRLINYGSNVTVDRDPLTREVNPFGLIDQPTNTYYKIWAGDTKYTFCCGKGVCQGNNLMIYLDTVVCVSYGTKILMEDLTLKPIEQIVRGDVVIGYQGNKYQVAEINKQYVPKESLVDMIEFLPNSLGDKNPSDHLYVTPNHPIFFKGARRPAKVFKSLPNVIEHTGVKPNSILRAETHDEYYLYDLQFDDDGSYLAEGVLIQSRSPWSDITPLAKELYFDQSRYKEETNWDGFNHLLPLDERELIP